MKGQHFEFVNSIDFWFIVWHRFALRFDGSWRRSPGRQNNGNSWEGIQPQSVWQLYVASILEDSWGHRWVLLIIDSPAMGQYPSCTGTNKWWIKFLIFVFSLFSYLCVSLCSLLVIWGGNKDGSEASGCGHIPTWTLSECGRNASKQATWFLFLSGFS